MSLVEKKVLMAVCDKCGDRYEHDFVPYFSSASDAAEELADSDWIVFGESGSERVLCNDCITYEECPKCDELFAAGTRCEECPSTDPEQKQPPATAEDNGGRASDDRGFAACPAGCVRKLGHPGHHATSPFPYPEDAQ